ncbi:hypothetical protein QJS10_CPB04g01566 [Acorus calamus]|uniref:Late embryogenesis abundant protein LEA-2 subgroup domain-containing protein n=1 Tax=Acorus calamus TaxID=4465 RepID=A0AAV9EXJ0_ACOCL|nr:hypothetical protein QJS10_CPB04g01566 [Acorus calamus]
MQKQNQHHLQQQNQPQTQHLKTRQTRHTNPLMWFTAVFCVLFWVVVILGGLVVLIVYLVFRPRSPRLDVPSVTLNAAYLDTGSLLNADLTILANFSNPNKKVDIVFTYVIFDLYFGGTLIATRAVDPFAERRGTSQLKNVHMVTSEVALGTVDVGRYNKEMASGRFGFTLMGRFKTTSLLGRFMHYTYWLHGTCRFVVGGPPSGVLMVGACRTRR